MSQEVQVKVESLIISISFTNLRKESQCSHIVDKNYVK